jgi:hypothetical protein
MTAPPRDIWTFTDWLAAGGWPMYVIELGAAIALPLNIISAFRPGSRIRRAALVATAAVVVTGLAVWWWSLHRLEAAIQGLPEEQQDQIRAEGRLELRGALETLAVIVALSAIAFAVGKIVRKLSRQNELKLRPRGAVWPVLGSFLYIVAGIFLLPQAAFLWAYAVETPSSRRTWALAGGLVAQVVGTFFVVGGSMLREVRRRTSSTP